MQGEFSFYEKTWKNISTSAKDLISSLLAVDPSRRPNAEEVPTHQKGKRENFKVSSTWS